ncbi:unnamed protein product [Gordionus sp. m RMFG-2023]
MLLTNNGFQIAINHRLGCLTPSVDICAACNKQVDPFSRHCFSCLKIGGPFLRHDNLNRFGKSLMSVGFPNSMELLGLLNEDGERPNGMSLHHSGSATKDLSELCHVLPHFPLIETTLGTPRNLKNAINIGPFFISLILVFWETPVTNP